MQTGGEFIGYFVLIFVFFSLIYLFAVHEGLLPLRLRILHALLGRQYRRSNKGKLTIIKFSISLDEQN